MIFMMMMKLLSGTIVIKNVRHRNKNKRRVNAYCLESIKVAGLVGLQRREKTGRKIVVIVVS